MVFKFALVVMVVFLNSATDGKYLLVKLDDKLANKWPNDGCGGKGGKYISSSVYICGDESLYPQQLP